MPTGKSSRQTWRKLSEVMDVYNDKKELLIRKLIEKTQIQDGNLTDIEEKTKNIYQLLEEREKREQERVQRPPV
jgi:DNA/RNA-binding domain of Phe-tRNA-synthetase-like protein